MEYLRKIGCIAGAVVIAFSMTFVSAKSLDQQKNEVENEKKNNEAKSNELQNNITASQNEINALDKKIAEEEIALSKIEKQIAKYDTEIAEKERALELEDMKLGGQDDLLKARLRTIYENGNASFFDVLMTSANISEFLSKTYVVTQMMEYDKQIMSSIGDQKDYIDNIKKELEEQKSAREKAKNEQALKVKNLEANKSAKTSLMNKLKSDKTAVDNRVKQLEQEEAVLAKKIQDEIDRINRENANKGNSSNNNGNNNNNNNGGSNSGKYEGGTFAWPVPGFKRISSGYGWRESPRQFHKGIDIAQYGQIAGAPIVAAADGEVIFAAFGQPGSGYGGYGYCVAIYHSGGISTMYAHQSRLAVSKGQKVKKGQVIGYVGNSGWSEGYHLHFEVRKNGSAIDPMPYFS